MKDKKVEIFNNEFDRIKEKFKNEEYLNQKFKNYSKRLKSSHFKSQRLHKRSRECQVHGCQERTVKKSHSIPKSSVLRSISTDGHLLAPKFDGSHNYPKVKMIKVGVENASVFPGFCQSHENIFEMYEADGKLDNTQKALLQTYRIICRERVHREVSLEINQIVKAEYRKEINNKALGCFKEALSLHSINTTNLKSISITGIDSVINKFSAAEEFVSAPLVKLREFEIEIFNWLEDRASENELMVKITNLDVQIPVSICGIASQGYIENGETKKVYVLLNVMPHHNSTDIVCVALEQDNFIVDQYFEAFFESPLSIINMIESFMINGSDHWFINPNIWERLPEQRREKLLQDIIYSEESIFSEYAISIFDELRLKVVSTLQENIQKRDYNITDFEKETIEHELGKIQQKSFDLIEGEEILLERFRNRMNR